MSPRLPESSANVFFELSGDHGTAPVTRYQTYRADSPLESAFKAYAKRHYESWVAFARNKQNTSQSRGLGLARTIETNFGEIETDGMSLMPCLAGESPGARRLWGATFDSTQHSHKARWTPVPSH